MEDRAGSIGASISRDACSDHQLTWARRRDETMQPHEVRLADVWSDLRDGRLGITRHSVSENACHAVLESRSQSEALAHGLSPAQAEVFERVVAGERQKTLAIDLRLSPATIALRVQRCIQRLGLDGKASRLPLFVIQAALTASPSASQRATATLELVDGGALFRLARADLILPAILTCAEQHVARMFVEGRALSQIAAARRAKTRTVSNQLRSIFAKLRVTGRLDLIARLAHGEYGDGQPLIRPSL